MKISRFIIVLIIMAATSTLSCKKPYNPPATSTPNSYLVVEGVIDAGADSTVIKLSRTVRLTAGTTINPVTGATVAVQGSNNVSYALLETTAGSYAAPGLKLDITKQYQLIIKTADNKQYISNFVPVVTTPPIDSVGFVVQSNGIQLFVNTHSANQNTRYYRWDYQETWQFHAKYYTGFISNGTAIVPRTIDQLVYSCFGSDQSSNIILGSSAKLSQNVIFQNPLTYISSTSEKIETRYSILVHEYALSADAYTFYTNIKKNTEQLGSVFDALPSEISGNIRNMNDASEHVIGYLSVCTVESKRIFIDYRQLPLSWVTTYPYNCVQDSDFFSHPFSGTNDVANNLIPLPNSTIPTSSFSLPGGIGAAGYLASDQFCVDCTLRGTTKQPAFWK